MIPTRRLALFRKLEKDAGDAAPSPRHTSSGGLLGTSVANLTPVYEPKFSDSWTKRLDFPSPQSWSSDPQCNVTSAAAAHTSSRLCVAQGVIHNPFVFITPAPSCSLLGRVRAPRVQRFIQSPRPTQPASRAACIAMLGLPPATGEKSHPAFLHTRIWRKTRVRQSEHDLLSGVGPPLRFSFPGGGFYFACCPGFRLERSFWTPHILMRSRSMGQRGEGSIR